MGCALSLKILSWLSYLDHQAIHAKDFEFLNQLLKKTKGKGVQAMVSLFFEDMTNKALNKDFFLVV